MIHPLPQARGFRGGARSHLLLAPFPGCFVRGASKHFPNAMLVVTIASIAPVVHGEVVCHSFWGAATPPVLTGTTWHSTAVKIWEDDARTGKRNHQTATAGATFLSLAFLSLGFLSPDSLVLVGLSISSRWGVSYWAVSYHWAISHRDFSHRNSSHWAVFFNSR